MVDLVISTIIIVVTSPLLAAIALAIRLNSKGPAIFHQTRVGKHGKHFTLYKFRTMYLGKSARGSEGRVIADRPLDPSDPGITPFGRWLRNTSLDELPQLVNVLKGEMSLVGPRPAIPEQVANYGDIERQRLKVLPGITGLAQISGRNTIDWDERIRLDVCYVNNRSIWMDTKIISATFFQIIRFQGIYHSQDQSHVKSTHS